MCACVYRFLFVREQKQIIWLVLAAYFALCSLASVYLFSPRGGDSLVAAVQTSSNFSLLYVAQFTFITLAFTWVNRHRRLHGFEIFFLVLLVIALSSGFIIDGLMYRFIIGGIFAFAVGTSS